MITRTVLAVDLNGDPAAIQAYRQHHREVWPEVVASLRRSGIRQMDIYLLGRRLVMILETDGQDFDDVSPRTWPPVRAWPNGKR